MHKTFLTALISIVLGAALVTIIQLWVPFLSWDVYVKAMITCGILTLVIGFLVIIKADLGEHKKLKDENYLD